MEAKLTKCKTIGRRRSRRPVEGGSGRNCYAEET